MSRPLPVRCRRFTALLVLFPLHHRCRVFLYLHLSAFAVGRHPFFKGEELPLFPLPQEEPQGAVVCISDPHNLKICCRVNGEVVQSSNTDQMVFKTEELIAWISQ